MNTGATPSRRGFLKAGAAAGLGFVAPVLLDGCGKNSQIRDGRPNIIFVTIDTARYDRMGFNGYTRDTTPYLSTVAQKGVVFHRHYSQSYFTGTSVPSMLLGRYPGNVPIGVYNDSSTLPLASLLQKRGYTTLGATSVSFLNEKNGVNTGFDAFSAAPLGANSNDGIAGRRFGQETIDALLELVNSNVNENTPYFCWVHLFDVHAHFFPHQGFTERFVTPHNFDAERRHIFASFMAETDLFQDRYDINYSSVGLDLLTDEQAAVLGDKYDGQVRYVDNQIERLITTLSEKNLFDFQRDALVINADHGDLLGEHGYFGTHVGGYEEVTHIPFLIAGASLPGGKSVDALTENVDIVPTLIELVDSKGGNIDPKWQRIEKNRWDGANLIPLASGSVDKVKDHVFSDFYLNEGVCVFDGTLRLVQRFYDEALAPIERDGFYPTGTVPFVLSPDTPYIKFLWPASLVPSGECEAHIQCRSRLGSTSGIIAFDVVVPVTAPEIRCALSGLWGEDQWNATAGMQSLVWSVKIVQRGEDDSQTVLYDSAKEGELMFRPQRTANFCQLFDTKNGPRDEGPFPSIDGKNVYDDPAYADARKKLEAAVVAFTEKYRLADFNKVPIGISDDQREDLRALGYL